MLSGTIHAAALQSMSEKSSSMVIVFCMDTFNAMFDVHHSVSQFQKQNNHPKM